MTAEQFYATRGDDYYEVLGRLGKEERIKKYLFKFLDDESMEYFDREYGRKNYEEAFRHIHSVKGMCLNLGLKKLLNSSSELCEALRNGKPTFDVTDLVAEVKADYEAAVNQIKNIERD